MTIDLNIFALLILLLVAGVIGAGLAVIACALCRISGSDYMGQPLYDGRFYRPRSRDSTSRG